MAELIGKEGEVAAVDSDGDVRLLGKCWNPALLERVAAATGRLQVGVLNETPTTTKTTTPAPVVFRCINKLAF